MKFYIAFSVRGTNKFKVATKNAELLQDLGSGFTAAASRRRTYDAANDGTKVHWNGLVRKDGTPIQDKGWVTKRFNQLQKAGWTLVQDKGHR